MGKQINYWMERDSFLLLARRAVELGCTIAKEDPVSGKVIESTDIGVVTADQKDYCFHLPEAGALAIRVYNGRERVERGFSASGNALIEAGYSFVTEQREIRRARMYCITGYYDENGDYIPRPECLTRVYQALVRYVKKLAPYTELVDTLTSIRDENYGGEYQYRHREYVTPACLALASSEGCQLR